MQSGEVHLIVSLKSSSKSMVRYGKRSLISGKVLMTISLLVIPPLCPHPSHTPSAGMGIMPVVGASQFMNVKYVYSPHKLSQIPSTPPPSPGARSFSVIAS